MKRILCLILALALALSLCACGRKTDEAPEEPEESAEPTPVVPTREPGSEVYEDVPEPTPEPTPDTRPFHRVEITESNWNTYFRLREIPLYSITNSGVIAQVYQTYCVVLRDEYLGQVKSDGEYSVRFTFSFDLYYNTLKVDTRNYSYGHTDDLMFEVSATKDATFDRYALRYSAYGTDHSRYSGYSNAFFTGWANIHPESKVWSGFYIDLDQVKLESVSGYLELAD
jgi:hypothetical protein